WRTEIAADATSLAPKGFKPHANRELRDFQISFLGRMIFSCLVDADFLDTEAFYASVDGRQVDRRWPALAAHCGFGPRLRGEANVTHQWATTECRSVSIHASAGRRTILLVEIVGKPSVSIHASAGRRTSATAATSRLRISFDPRLRGEVNRRE